MDIENGIYIFPYTHKDLNNSITQLYIKYDDGNISIYDHYNDDGYFGIQDSCRIEDNVDYAIIKSQLIPANKIRIVNVSNKSPILIRSYKVIKNNDNIKYIWESMISQKTYVIQCIKKISELIIEINILKDNYKLYSQNIICSAENIDEFFNNLDISIYAPKINTETINSLFNIWAQDIYDIADYDYCDSEKQSLMLQNIDGKIYTTLHCELNIGIIGSKNINKLLQNYSFKIIK